MLKILLGFAASFALTSLPLRADDFDSAGVRVLKMPIAVVVGERDPCRKMYVDPLLQLRPDIPEHVISGAGHITCILKPEFKTELAAALSHNHAGR